MSYYARFVTVYDAEFRLDTRIYLEDGFHSEESGVCVAAIVGKNPGSACSTKFDRWERLTLAGDKMLPGVRNRFIEGYRLSGKQIPQNAFIRVWNLFYLCNEELDLAVASHSKIASNAPTCPSEKIVPKIIWFAWGGFATSLNPFKARFQNLTIKNVFYFDNHSGKIVTRIPSQMDFAKHPQGLSKKPIVEHLASVL
jgi:hypothetical protein